MKTSASEEKPTIYVNTLGGFSIKVGDKEITDNSNQSKKPWCLLEYLVVFQKKDISPNELINVIWADDPGVNPQGALKTLMFRSRKLLEPLELPPQKLLVQQRGSYAWTQEYPTQLDIDRFEAICTQVINHIQDEDAALKLCLEGLAIYKGDFLPKSEYESWVIPISTYYHSLYQKLVRAVSEDLMERGDYAQVEEICTQAVSIDRFTEDFHYYLIYAAYKKGDQKKALQNYRDTTEMFYRERLMTPSERFKEMYRVISDSEQEVITDLNVIQEALGRTSSCGEEKNRGAYQCEYAVFKRLVQLERRGVERSGDSVYLCLLTVGDRKGRTLKPEIQARAMERLRNVINSSLRSSDAFARYSVSQFIILLPSATYENGEQVMHRILSAFNKAYVRKDVSVSYSLNVVLPQEEILQ